MLTVRNLYTSRAESKGNFQLQDINLELSEGMIYTLLGRNGAGKSTLLEAIYGILSKSQGEVIYDGEKVDRKSLSRYHREVALVAGQLMWYAPHLSVRDNVEFLKVMYDSFDSAQFYDYLKRFDLPATELEKTFSQLSAGQSMQVQIAFAAARSPKIMLLDEPFANLDPVVKLDIMDVLQTLVAKNNMSILVSTHLVDEIDEVTDYVAVLDGGRLTHFGSRTELPCGEGYGSLRALLTGGER